MNASRLVKLHSLEAALPDGWQEVSLSDLGAELRPGFASGRHNSEGRGLLHVRPMNISPLGEIDLKVSRYLDDVRHDVRLEAGDIVFNNTNSLQWVGKTAAWTAGPAGYSNHMTRVRLPGTLEPAFIAKQLHMLCLRGYFQTHARQHVNQASVSLSFLRDRVPLRMAPPATQARILKRLATLELRRQRVWAALRTVLAHQEPLRAAVLEHAFSEVDDSTALPLGDLTDGRIHYGIVQPGEEVPDGVPVVRSGDLRSKEQPQLTTLKRVDRGIEEKHSKTRLRGGELLLSVRGTVGPLALVSEQLAGANVTRGIAVIRPGQRIRSAYVAMYLTSPAGQAAILAKVRGVAQQSISLGDLSAIPVPVPPLDEQDAIAASLRTQLDRLDSAAGGIEAALVRVESMHRVLLERAFNGELVEAGDDTAAETAAEIIER